MGGAPHLCVRALRLDVRVDGVEPPHRPAPLVGAAHGPSRARRQVRRGVACNT